MFKDENRHYSLRKLSVGLASVLIGISFASMTGNSVKADTVNGDNNGAQTVIKGNDAAAKIDAKDNANVTEFNTKSANEAIKKNPNAIAQDIKQKAAKGDVPESIAKNATDGSQIVAESTLRGSVNTNKDDISKATEKGSLTINNDAVKDTVEAAKQGLKTPAVKHADGNETTLNVKDSKTEVKGNQALGDPAKSKLKTATLMAIAGKKLNAQMLFASKILSPANDTNGGFDEATWGKLNVNDWKGSVQGDYYQLTDYTGDANHVIVPNDADFAKAGISTSGKQVGVTSDLMHTIFREKATAQDATVAFSKTDNKQVKAIGTDWRNTWGHSYDHVNGSYIHSKGELTKFDGTNLDVSAVTNMNSMFQGNEISDLSSLADWKVDRVTDMGPMFADNQISNLASLASWNVDHVTNMGAMFQDNQISDISPLANWRVSQVKRMLLIFDGNISSIKTNTVQAKRIINFVYPDGYEGKKQDPVTQIVDVPTKQIKVELTTKYPKPSNNILDWATKTETPESPDSVYFQDYTVPEIKGLLEPDKTVISGQQADITKPINVTVTYEWAMSTTSKIVASYPNDAFALDPKNGLHEHANVNNNGGYDEDYWGKLNINDWNYTTNNDTITITGYKGNNPASLIIPNGADFELANGQGAGQANVEISSSVMHDLAKNATRIGLSKTANKKVIASNTDWSDAFGGITNEPGTTSNANGGIKYSSPNLTQMDLHNLDTTAITDMSALFNGGSNLTTVGDLSDWNTNNVTNMRSMFQAASSLTNIGNLDNWDTRRVTDMSAMFGYATNLTNIGDLSKWQTGNVTNMHSMFSNATNLTNIGNLDNWDTSNVTDMDAMFAHATNLSNIGNLSKWQTGNVTDMHNMFANATSLTNIGNLDNWDTSKVTDMSWMFGTDSSKQSHLMNIGDLYKWQTGNVTNMSYMFFNATNLTNIGNLDNWNTGNVTNMTSMFYNATHLTNIGDLSKWNTSKVTNMLAMFGDTNALSHLNISNWNLTKLANKNAMKYMFANDVNLTVIANDLKLPTWYQNEINDADYFWNDHMAVITNVPELIRATGDINNLKIDDQDASRSIFYDSKGSSDAIQVLKDTNNQYIADYHKANPTKFLKLADTVDQNDPIALANANFITVPAAVGLTVHFEDVDPNADRDSDTVKQELAKTVELSGHSGDAADLSQVQLPTNFELSGNLPNVTFGDTDSVTIKLKHKLSDELTSKRNGVASVHTEVIAPDGTVLIQGNAEIRSFIDQRQDLVTRQMVNGDTHWTYVANSQTNVSADILNKYIEQYTPMDASGHDSTEGWQYATMGGLRQPLQIKLKDGYTVNSLAGWENSDNNDTYTWVGIRGATDWDDVQRSNNGTSTLRIAPLDQSVHYQFMDNGTQIGSDVIVTGKTDETVSTNLSIPENYELANGTTLPTSYTFAATNPTIQINLKHKTETSVESLPATRTINVHLPNGTTKVYQQIIGYQRDVITDLVTKAVTRGTWTVNDVTSSFTIDGVKQLEHSYVLRNGSYNFAGIKLPKVPGYKAKVSRNNGLLLVSYLALAPEKPEINTNLNDQFSNNLAVNSTVKSDLIVKSDMYQVVNDNHNWQLPVIKNYELKFATNKNQIIFAYTKDKQDNYRFVLTFKDGQYRLATFDKENKLLKTYSIKSYDELAKIIHSLVLMNIA